MKCVTCVNLKRHENRTNSIGFCTKYGVEVIDSLCSCKKEKGGTVVLKNFNAKTPLTAEEKYKLLQKKHEETDWNNLQSIKEYNEYARMLRKMGEQE